MRVGRDGFRRFKGVIVTSGIFSVLVRPFAQFETGQRR